MPRDLLKFFGTALILSVVLVVLATVELTFLAPEKPLEVTDVVSMEKLFSPDRGTLFGAPHAIATLPTTFRSSIDGTKILYGPPEDEQVIAVMIENHPDSRAQMEGLASASIVYEAIAEGSITRFLAIFNHFTIEKVGPVRSARPYFVDFAEEYRAPYSHAGGSPPALKQVHNGKVLNVEALYLEEIGDYFFRDRNYYAPHNMFGNLRGIVKYRDKKKWDKSIGSPRFVHADDDVLLADMKGAADATEINIRFSNALHQVRYEYDEKNRRYNRFLANKKHVDHGLNKQITVKNILIQETTYQPYDDYGRLKMVTSGKNTARLFTLGKTLSGYWKKSEGITRFYSDEGTVFTLAPGNTWIEVIKKGRVTYDAANEE